MEGDPTKGLQPGRRHGFHPAQRAAVESRYEGAEEENSEMVIDELSGTKGVCVAST